VSAPITSPISKDACCSRRGGCHRGADADPRRNRGGIFETDVFCFRLATQGCHKTNAVSGPSYPKGKAPRPAWPRQRFLLKYFLLLPPDETPSFLQQKNMYVQVFMLLNRHDIDSF
jgi:hypothetical protein